MLKKKIYILLIFQNITQIVKNKLSALSRGITSKKNGDFCCLNCLHFFTTINKLESHKRVCENKHFCNVIMIKINIDSLKKS